jgi:DNA-binding NtrC family response regulator
LKRVGSTSVRNLDIRIIAATNQDLRKMVEGQTFREDLFHRLSTVSFEVPGLADRRDDIAPLSEHFLRIFCSRYGKPVKSLTDRALGVLSSYSWPGNVRELESVMDYCCLMCVSDRIDVGDLPMFVQTSSANTLLSLEEMEQKHLHRVLKLSRGNRDEAAAVLGIGRATVYRMLTDAKKARPGSRYGSGEGRHVRRNSNEPHQPAGPA